MRGKGLLLTGSSIGWAAAAVGIVSGFYPEVSSCKSWFSGGENVNEENLKEKNLLQWTRGASMDRVNKADPKSLDPKRHVVVLTGITGSGKSSCGNTMMTARKFMQGPGGRSDHPMIHDSNLAAKEAMRKAEENRKNKGIVDLPVIKNRKFAVAGSLTSVTKSAAYRDYNFRGVPYRVVDMPGLADTNRDVSTIRDEMHAFAKYSPHGVAAFCIVLPKGRITHEHEEALQRVNRIFGDDLEKHAILVLTHAMSSPPNSALLTREMILEEIDKLPKDHFLRELVERVNFRVVGVENNQEPHKSVSQILLNQAVLEVLEANNGKTYDVSHLLNGSFDNVFAEAKPKTRQRPCTIIRQVDSKSREKGVKIMCEKGSKIPDMLIKFLEATDSCTDLGRH